MVKSFEDGRPKSVRVPNRLRTGDQRRAVLGPLRMQGGRRIRARR